MPDYFAAANRKRSLMQRLKYEVVHGVHQNAGWSVPFPMPQNTELGSGPVLDVKIAARNPSAVYHVRIGPPQSQPPILLSTSP